MNKDEKRQPSAIFPVILSLPNHPYWYAVYQTVRQGLNREAF